jgi:NADH:ubiquinone oxidoreductase subunit 5 (subunit L)/multisubunit Na+/H+ antiporter MnhA subunit
MFGSALTLASFVKIIHSIFLSRLPDKLKGVKEVSPLMFVPMLVLAFLCVFFGIFYYVPLKAFIYPALGIEGDAEILSTWGSGLATILILVGIGVGVLMVFIGGLFARKVRIVPTWTCGEKQANDDMIIPGTHFYKTVSSMGGLRQLYSGQEKGYFDPYDQGGKVGLALTDFLKWLHCGILPVYLTWVTLGLLIVLFAVCRIW